jgi:hypothetical protein
LKHGEVRDVEMSKEMIRLQYLQRRKKLQQLEERKKEAIGENTQVVLVGNNAAKLKGIPDTRETPLLERSVTAKSLLNQVRMLK